MDELSSGVEVMRVEPLSMRTNQQDLLTLNNKEKIYLKERKRTELQGPVRL